MILLSMILPLSTPTLSATMLLLILSLVILAGLAGAWWLVGSIAKELDQMDGDEDLTKKIEKWRDGE